MAPVLSQIQKEALICGIIVAIKKKCRQKQRREKRVWVQQWLLCQKTTTRGTASALLDEVKESDPRSFANYVCI